MSWNRYLGLLAVGVAIALVITLFSPFASGEPDGLERVAEDQGFIDQAKDAPYEILPDYTIPGAADERLARVLAGVVGVLIVAALTYGVGGVLRRRARQRSANSSPPA